MKANVKRPLDSSYAKLQRVITTIGRDYVTAWRGSEGTLSRRLSSVMGNLQKSAQLIKDATRELHAIDQAQAAAMRAARKASKPARSSKPKREGSRR